LKEKHRSHRKDREERSDGIWPNPCPPERIAYFCTQNHTIYMRQFLTISLMLASFVAWGQKEVVSAYNANKSGNYAEAVTYIEQAIVNEKSAIKEKTWRYRGDIYVNVAKDPELFAAYPAALVLAYESFAKAKELDTKGSYEREITAGLGQVQAVTLDLAIENYNQGNYLPAGGFFDLSSTISNTFSIVDTMAIFNAALCYEKAGAVDLAIERYESCAEIGYQVPNVYLFMATILRNVDRKEDALVVLQNARANYPREQSILIEELNIYLENKEYDRALENLALAAELDPGNEILWFSLGSVHDNLGNASEAQDAYKKALDIKPTYFDANYNLGAMFFNQGVQEINLANEMWKPRMSKVEEADQRAHEGLAKELFAQARPYLEAARLESPEDVDTLRSLRDIYARTGEDDLMLEVSGVLKGLGQ
jgi:tetratricopeptide (TPR) repeat protein